MEQLNDASGDSTPGSELAEKTRLQGGGGYEPPEVGSWHWVICQDERNGHVHESRELMFVDRVYSNHVSFSRFQEDDELGEAVRHEDMLALTTPEPRWRDFIMAEMADVQLAIREKTAALLDDAVKKNALPPTGAAAAPSSTGLELSLRVVDPKKQKADLVTLQSTLATTQKEIKQLSKEYAGLCKNLMGSELAICHRAVRDLGIIEDKIFVIEVYSGLQEQVRQIAEGDPAPIDTRITIRQSMLYMDEETLIDYQHGGLDFNGIEKFDAWVCKPKNLNRVLPEKRGIVAWRVRRKEKDYGRPETLSMALKHMAWHAENFATYLLIRNGSNVYRIISDVDFSPRLIPYRTEFDNAFTETQHGWFGESDTKREITPHDLDYDDTVNKLKKDLGHYNKIVVLIQGLLDRSDVFHPHTPINLSSGAAIDEWLNPVRDEEDVVEYNGLHWRKYMDDRRALIKAGTVILSHHVEVGRAGYEANRRPSIITVDRVRKCNARDQAKYEHYNEDRYRDGKRKHSEVDEPEIGEPGVEVSWPYGTRWGYSHGSYGTWCEMEVNKRRVQWLPLDAVFNLTDYRLGDFRYFLADRRQKAEYDKWAPACFAAEDWYYEKAHPEPTSDQ